MIYTILVDNEAIAKLRKPKLTQHDIEMMIFDFCYHHGISEKGVRVK